MAVIANAPDPEKLLTSLKNKVATGAIDSWTVDDTGHFCHKAAQIKGKCCFKPSTAVNVLRFEPVWYPDVKADLEIWAELHAHAVRMLIVHGRNEVTSVQVPVA